MTQIMFNKLINLYNQILSENFGSDPTDNSKREFIKEHFTVLQSNLTNYYKRITYKGLMVTLHNPDLNKQVSHK